MCWFPTPHAPKKLFMEAEILLLIQKVEERKEEDEDVKNFLPMRDLPCKQARGRFLGIIGQDPSVSKSNP